MFAEAQGVLNEVQATVSKCGSLQELESVLTRLGALCKRNRHGIFNAGGKGIGNKCRDVLTGAAWEAAIVRKNLDLVQTLDKFVRCAAPAPRVVLCDRGALA